MCNSLMIVVYSVPGREQVTYQTILYPYSTWSLTCVWQTLGLTPVLYVPFIFIFIFISLLILSFQGHGYNCFHRYLNMTQSPAIFLTFCIPPSVFTFHLFVFITLPRLFLSFPVLPMTKREYHSWSPLEEANLPQWVARHLDLSWEERAEKYSSEVSKGRTSESLRSKYTQLRKGIKRHRPIHSRPSSSCRRTAQQARHQQQRALNGPVSIVVPAPPVLMKARSTRMQARWRQVLKNSSSHQPQAHPAHQLSQPRIANSEQPVTTPPTNEMENNSHYQSPVTLCPTDTSQGRSPKLKIWNPSKLITFLRPQQKASSITLPSPKAISSNVTAVATGLPYGQWHQKTKAGGSGLVKRWPNWHGTHCQYLSI